MMQEKLIEEVPTLEVYFKNQIEEAMMHQHGRVDKYIAFYLVNLLSHFSNPQHVFKQEDGTETPLALLYFQAQQESPEVKSRMLKYLGDVSLFVSGFFQESLNRKIVDIDYYRSMGEGAYQQLSSMDLLQGKKSLLSDLFSQLSHNFTQWIDILSEVSEQSHFNTHSDILRLYEKWMKTKSDRAREMLVNKGIIPIEAAQSQFLQ